MRRMLKGALAGNRLVVASASAVGLGSLYQCPTHAESDRWEATTKLTLGAVVSLNMSTPCAFDTFGAGNGRATGFVVDVERGLIVTNRHVVGAGPIEGEAMFQNNEVVTVTPVYADPVHDFGILRFDPAEVKYHKLTALELRPDDAQVGAEIRVIGSDAGEKISVNTGVLADLERAAPTYGSNTYNDFNTFYFKAASSTTGGSSGSPVISIDGKVVALNAGGKVGTAAGFYLPLASVHRALSCIQQGLPVTRGSLQTVFQHKSFDDLRKLGMGEALERQVRQDIPTETGMLTVSEVIPGGPADGLLHPGDILVRVGEKLITRFDPVEQLLDSSVGQKIEMIVSRAGEEVALELEVGNLHSISPSEFLTVGGAVINPLSYQQARNHSLTVGAPYVAQSGFLFRRAGVPDGAIITSINHEQTPDLATLRSVVEKLGADGNLVISYRHPNLSRQTEHMCVTRPGSRMWFEDSHCYKKMGDKSYEAQSWHSDPLNFATAEAVSDADTPEGEQAAVPTVDVEPQSVTEKLGPSLVTVDFGRPFPINGITSEQFRGTGVVVDTERGLVVTDRMTVPSSLGSAAITFDNSQMVAAQVLFIHPDHNLAVLQYEPKSLEAGIAVKAAEISTVAPNTRDEVHLVALNSKLNNRRAAKLVSRQTRIGQISWTKLSLPRPPAFIDNNVDLIDLEDRTYNEGGVVADSKGAVVALWAAFPVVQNGTRKQFQRGLAAAYIKDCIDMVTAAEVDPAASVFKSLGVDLEPIAVGTAKALQGGSTFEFPQSSRKSDSVLAVVGRHSDAPGMAQLQDGDLLIDIDGEEVRSFREVELATSGKKQVQLSIVRAGALKKLELETVVRDGWQKDRVVGWAGTVCTEVPIEVIKQRRCDSRGVYVAARMPGSPASSSELQPTTRIVEVNGHKTESLDEFVAVLKRVQNDKNLRIKNIDLQDRPRMTTLRPSRFWKPYEVAFSDGRWRRR